MSGLRFKRKYFTDQGDWRGLAARLGQRWLEGVSWNRVGPLGRGPGFGGGLFERDHGLWAAGKCLFVGVGWKKTCN